MGPASSPESNSHSNIEEISRQTFNVQLPNEHLIINGSAQLLTIEDTAIRAVLAEPVIADNPLPLTALRVAIAPNQGTIGPMDHTPKIYDFRTGFLDVAIPRNIDRAQDDLFARMRVLKQIEREILRGLIVRNRLYEHTSRTTRKVMPATFLAAMVGNLVAFSHGEGSNVTQFIAGTGGAGLVTTTALSCARSYRRSPSQNNGDNHYRRLANKSHELNERLAIYKNWKLSADEKKIEAAAQPYLLNMVSQSRSIR